MSNDKKINVLFGANTAGLQEGMKQAAAIIDNGGKQIAASSEQAAKASSTSYKSLQQAYRATYKDAQILAQQQGVNSQAFQEAARAAAQYKDELEDVQDAIKAASPEQRWNVVGQAIQGAAQVAQGFVGSMQLIGVETQDAEKAIAQMMALQGVSNAISGVFQLKDAFQALNVATQSSLIGVAALAAAWLVYNATAEDTVEANKRIAESAKAIQDVEDKIIGVVFETSKLRVKAMKDGKEKELAEVQLAYKRELALLEEKNISGAIAEFTYLERKKLLFQDYQNQITAIEDKAEKERQKNKRKPESNITPLSTKSTNIGDLMGMAGGALQSKVQGSLDKFWTNVNASNLKGISQFNADFQGLITNTQQVAAQIELTMGQVASAISGTISNMVDAAMSGGDVGKALVSSLLGSMGAFLKEWGTQLILVGIGAEALKASLKSLNGIAAIAAGVAMVAAGSAAVSAASSMASSGGSSYSSGGSSSSYGGGSSFMPPSFQGTQYLMLDGKVRGQDLVIATGNTNRDNRRVR